MNYSHNVQLNDVAPAFVNRLQNSGVAPIDHLCLVIGIEGTLDLTSLEHSIHCLRHLNPVVAAQLLAETNLAVKSDGQSLLQVMKRARPKNTSSDTYADKALAETFAVEDHLLRIRLYGQGKSETRLVISCHRLIADEQQLYQLTEQLIGLYRDFIKTDDAQALLKRRLAAPQNQLPELNDKSCLDNPVTGKRDQLAVTLDRTAVTALSGWCIEHQSTVPEVIATAWNENGPLHFYQTPSVGFACKDGVRFYIDCFKSTGSIDHDMVLSLNLREGKLVGQLNFDKSQFTKAAVKKLVEQFEQRLQQPTSAQIPNRIDQDELYLAFEAITEQFAESPAVTYQAEDKTPVTLSYQQLNQAANHLAVKLQQMGVTPGVVVGSYTQRCHLSFVSMLAIFKAGGIYLPLDIVQPEKQLMQIVEHAEAQVIVTSQACEGRLQTEASVTVESAIEAAKANHCDNLDLQLDQDRPTLLLFTSGSTGKPKGVLHKQAQLINRYRWLVKNYPFAEGEVACQRTNLGYQPSLWEMLGGLLQGIPTVVVDDNIVKDPYLFKAALTEHKVTHLTLVPSLLQTLLRDSTSEEPMWSQIKTLITAGEPLSLELMKSFTAIATNATLLNDYGSTETNGILYFDSRNVGDKLPGFNVVDNVNCDILDENLQAVKAGETGELFVGGISLALSYFNAPDLTAEKFLHHPQNGRRLFRMGDLARQRNDGSIEILGRADNQVKIRGNKVELEGVETVLQSCDGVVECAIGVRTTSGGNKSLVGYVVLTAGTTEDSVRMALESKLPDFMQPTMYHSVDSIPRNPNGKVDRSQLKESQPKAAPQTQQVEVLPQLLAIAAQVLDIDLKMVGADRKFYELGFDSGNIVTFVQDINKALSVELRLADLYDLATVGNLAEHVTGLMPTQIAQPEPEPEPQPQPQPVLQKSEPVEGQMNIAIIGMSGCYAGAQNLNAYWHNLRDGVDSIEEVPEKRWSAEQLYSEDITKPFATVSKWGGFIEDADAFDAAFFDMTPQEALHTDPQQRLSLQQCWRTLEDAGYSDRSLAGRSVGVFIGHRTSDYINTINDAQKEPDAYTLTGNDSAVLAARLAYHLNLKGPSLSVDTACSSSLVAIHLACQSLQAGDSEMALAGGVCVMSTPLLYQQSSKLGMLSIDGKCKSFDNSANGFVPGEGVGFVLLKNLEQAEADNDQIHAVVRGSGINHDGRTNGMTAPNAIAQQALLTRIYQQNNINPADIGFIETHGTGTKLGDPIEFEALKAAFAEAQLPANSCALGAVKTNIGHTIAAAGIAGVHKLVLALKNKQIPANLNYSETNELIDFASSPFYPNTELQDWTNNTMGAVSSFGFSGTNGHLVIEEYQQDRNTTTTWPQLFPVSAKSETALAASIKNLHDFVNEVQSVELADIAFTLQNGRSHFKHRAVVVASNKQQLLSQLADPSTIQIEQASQSFKTVAQDYLNGNQIDWSQISSGGQTLSLPGYPFDQSRFWLSSETRTQATVQEKTVIQVEAGFEAAVTAAVQEVIAKVTGFEASELQAEKPLEHIGINSVMILMLNKAMSEYFGRLPDTLFYENQSIKAIANYLCRRKTEQTAAALDWSLSEQPATVEVRQQITGNAATGQSQQIAIVGLSGRYPGADTLDQFWHNLCEGKDSISEIPTERWSYQTIYNKDSKTPGDINSKWGGFLNDIDCFDPLFFNISPKDANLQDPQERLFLQTAWHSLEDAGYNRQSLSEHAVGVFVGVVWSEYQLFGIEEASKGNPVYPNASFSSIANRVSYCLNVNGPSMAVDTMCSSSLTAIHLACQSILNNECDMAIAGGVNLSLHPTKYQLLAQGRFLSSDGRCRSFAQGGDGYVPGEGVGAVVLKTLSAAQSDGDQIYAVIKGSALNHGGKTNGYTVPNPNAQGDLIKAAMSRCGVDPESISYIEAHGTGTDLGDPIEMAGLQQAFEQVDPQQCAIGSVKSNIGHLEAAAGIAGLSKILLQMKHQQLVPSIHAEQINPKIDFESSPFHLQTKLQPWLPYNSQGHKLPRRAAISAFGAGGSNAHLVLEAYDKDSLDNEVEQQPSQHQLFLLSARNDEQLKQQAEQLLSFVKTLQQPTLTGDQVSNLVLQQLAEVLHVNINDIDDADHLIDYLSGQADIEHFAVALNQVLPLTVTTKTLLAADTIHGVCDVLAKALVELQGNLTHDHYNLRDIAYTLQIGREPMASRMAVIANNGGDLLSSLQSYIDGESSSTSLVSGSVKHSALDLDGLLAGDAGHEFVNRLIQQQRFRQLAQLWVAGIAVDWLELYGQGPAPQRVSLPLYPFAKERYWVEQVEAPSAKSAQLHPLVQRNESTLRGQKFCSDWDAQALFFDHHKVGDKPTLPGVAYLEMMLTALSLSLETQVDVLTNVVFAQPIAFGEERQQAVEISVIPQDQQIDVRVESTNGDLHSRAKMKSTAAETATIDLTNYQGQTSLNSEQCYTRCRQANMNYGASFQVLQQVSLGNDFALGSIKLPSDYTADMAQFRLHPAIMDGGLQTLLILMSHIPALSGRVFLPYSVEQVQVHGELSAQCLALVKAVNDSNDNPMFDITLMSEQGQPLVSLTGLMLRSAKPAQSEDELLYYKNSWQPAPLAQAKASVSSLLLLLPDNIESAMAKQALLALDHQVDNLTVAHQSELSKLTTFPQAIISLWGLGTKHDAQSYLQLGREVLTTKPAQQSTDLIFVYGGEDQPLHQALGGFAKTLRIENPQIRCKNIGLSATSPTLGEALDTALVELQNGESYVSEVQYKNQQRQVRKLVETDNQAKSLTPKLSDNSVVLITGGAGKLGLLSAQWVKQRQPQATIILSGRSQPSGDAIAQIEQLNGKFMAADVTDKAQTQTLLQTIERQYGPVTGIIHCAGVIRDSYLLRKTDADINAVVGPKIQGTDHLDQLTQHLALDFFILYSSISALLGNPGQSDYAFANSYLDSFATHRNNLVSKGLRSGKTLSINWPLWADGGMPVDQRTADNLRRQWGVVPLSDELGMQHLDHALGQSEDNFIFVYGVADKLRTSMCINDEQAIYGRSNKATTKKAAPVASANSKNVQDQAQQYIVQLLCEQTKMTVEQLDIHASFDEFGIDSVTIADLNDQLEAKFNDLPQTLLFEYQTVAELATYFAENHASAFGEVEEEAVNTKERPAVEELPQRFVTPQPISSQDKTQSKDIAIIGISGRYPQADDLNTFWNNLLQGRNCVEQVPAHRWDWREYYSETVGEQGKTNTQWGGFINDVDKFDPLFFNISPAEAEQMDPQERLSIEMVWHALEDAGYTRESLRQHDRITGLYIGSMYKHYPWVAKDVAAGPFLSISSYWNITNRVSYLFNFQGPSVAVDTACASSLTAVQMACDSINNGQCTTAVAGGVNLSLHPDKFVGLSESGMLSTGDTSRGLGQSDGYVSGEGIGMILLKPLALAEAEGDQIYAVIKGGAINHGGKTNGFSTPNPNAQVAVAQQALKNANLNPQDISYIETAANGAELGDMIEFNALNKVYSTGSDKREYCAMGSVKSNLGHLEAASGISQLTKVIMQAKHQTLAPSINAEPLNSRINFKDSAFYLNDSVQPWKSGYAAVNSIGAGGANAHLIIADYPKRATAQSNKTWPIMLSARTESQLEQRIEALIDALEQQTFNIADVAFTLAAGRESMKYRIAFTAKDQTELLNKLAERNNTISDCEFAAQVTEWLQNQKVDWLNVFAGTETQRVSLPSYPFERNRYWIPGTDETEQTQEVGSDVGVWLQQLIATQLKMPVTQVPMSQPLTELGFDSLQGMKLMNRLQQHCNQPLLASELMVLNNVDELAQYLISNQLLEQQNTESNVQTGPLAALLEKVALGQIDIDAAMAQEQQIRQRIEASEK